MLMHILYKIQNFFSCFSLVSNDASNIMPVVRKTAKESLDALKIRSFTLRLLNQAK